MNSIASEPRISCDLCGSAGELAQSGIRDPDGNLDGTWGFRRCGSCGTYWLDPAPPPQELWKAYATYHTHTRRSSGRFGKAMLSLAHRFIKLGLLPLWITSWLRGYIPAVHNWVVFNLVDGLKLSSTDIFNIDYFWKRSSPDLILLI